MEPVPRIHKAGKYHRAIGKALPHARRNLALRLSSDTEETEQAAIWRGRRNQGSDQSRYAGKDLSGEIAAVVNDPIDLIPNAGMIDHCIGTVGCSIHADFPAGGPRNSG